MTKQTSQIRRTNNWVCTTCTSCRLPWKPTKPLPLHLGGECNQFFIAQLWANEVKRKGLVKKVMWMCSALTHTRTQSRSNGKQVPEWDCARAGCSESTYFTHARRHLFITKTCLYNVDPLKPHWYLQGYTLFFLFLLKTYIVGEAVLTNTHNIFFELKCEKYQKFYLKIFILWW